MAFKEVTDLNADVVISLGGTNKKTGKKNPINIEGYYLGRREVEDRKKKSGVGYIYFFQTPKGNVGVWGKTDLDRKMLTAKTGTMMRITSTGTRPTPNGDMYIYRVEVDSENTIEVLSEETNFSAASEEADDSFEAADEEESYSAPAPSVVDEAAARRAKVQALLSKKK